jgi:Mrp family chromosome partitioning ATPase
MGTDTKLFPVKTTNDIEMMSINLMLETDDTPVIWRGPVIAGVVTQFWEDVDWSELDCMVIDMPPGTGDVPLTVFQSIPLDGVIIVTTPQDLVEMIVSKAVNMAKMMNIPVLGLVENMSYAVCPDCGRHIEIFGHSKIDELAARYSIPVLAKLPIDPNAAALCDEGKIERVVNPQMEDAAKMLAINFKLL